MLREEYNGFTNWYTFTVRSHELDEVVKFIAEGDLELMDAEQLQDYIMDHYSEVHEFDIQTAPPLAWEFYRDAMVSEVDWQQLAEWLKEAVKEY